MDEPRYVGRRNVAKRLAELTGTPVRTIYTGGHAWFELPEVRVTVTPPFGLEHDGEYDGVVAEPLLQALGRDRVVGALLVRLGGYAVGVFDGEQLVASKVGRRFVEGRHKKGGS